MTLPTNIDATYADDPDDASVKLHQQYHDTLHERYNNPSAPSGAAGGDLSGTYPNPSVASGSIGDSQIDLADPIGRDKIAVVEAVRDIGGSGNPAFATGWSNFGGVYEVAGFWYDPLSKMVHLRGLVKKSASGTATIFTLPSGYRPPSGGAVQIESFGILTSTSTRTGQQVTIFDTGVVQGLNVEWTTFSLSGISFRAGD